MDSFHNLEMKWGAPAAYSYLTEVEKAANIPSWKMANIDPETRLAHACRIHDLARSVQHAQAV